MDTIPAYQCTLFSNGYIFCVMATRQNSSNGKPKSPRVQVVLPEELCARLAFLAEEESRTVSNMAKVLIQEGVKQMELAKSSSQGEEGSPSSTKKFISDLEAQQPRRLRGAPRRFKINRS